MIKLIAFFALCVSFLIGGNLSFLSAQVQPSHPPSKSKAHLLVHHLTKKDIKTLKIVNTESDRIVMTIKSKDGKAYRLKPMTVSQVDELFRLISEGKTLKISYPSPKSKNYILADNWKFN